MEAIEKLSRDLKQAVSTLDGTQARYLVDTYYQMQAARIRAQGQVRAIDQGAEEAAMNPHGVLDWLTEQNAFLENQIKLALGYYARAHTVGKWMISQKGVGPVIAAGLLAHIDITKAPTVGHIWNFAGLNPGTKWEKGKRRPWNAQLKTLCAFKLGESFVKVQNREGAFYGQLFKERKALEIQRNDAGEFVEEAAAKDYSKSTDAWAWANGCFPAGTCRSLQCLDAKGRLQLLKETRLPAGKGQPMLAPAHIHGRARRWVVKLFLAHLHEVWYEHKFGEKPAAPYAIDILKHAHKIDVPAA